MPDPITPLLDGLTPAEQADVKASALSAIVGAADAPEAMLEWTSGGVMFAVQEATVKNGCLALNILAWDANGDLPAPDYAAGEYFYFRNPPIRVWTREPGTNGESDPGATVEDLTATLNGYVADAVLAYARNHGWQG